MAEVVGVFLGERARMERTTSYTELNAVLVRRAGVRGFDFGLDRDRVALGHLLGEVSERAFESTGGLLVSALVQYLDANDAGAGFYALARQKGFAVPRSAGDRQVFWATHVAAVHRHFAVSRRGGRGLRADSDTDGVA